MHSLLFLMLVTGSCLAHYRSSYDSRNFIVREEPMMNRPDDDGEYVECPVCEESEHWIASNEECIIRGNKAFKKCRFGTYVNEVCGGKLDCYSGPGERCTDKMEFDMLGKKCAPGSNCIKSLGKCSGLSYAVDPWAMVNNQYNRYPYTLRRSDKGADAKGYYKETRN